MEDHSHFMAFPIVCRKRYGAPWFVLLVGFIDFFDSSSYCVIVPSADVLVTAVLTFFLSKLHVDA